MMAKAEKRWVTILTGMAMRHTRWTLIGVGLLTLVSLILIEHLTIRMNWTDLLPEHNQSAMRYREIGDRFGEASIAVVLEGERDAIVAMAEELEPRLSEMEDLRNVVGKMPVEFIRDHGFVLVRPEQFDRMLDMFSDWSLAGTFRGINDDYEREYTSSEANLARDEVEIARSMLGITRSLELLSRCLAGNGTPEMMAEAADALSLGEPWILSLDRGMLLIACTPTASMDQVDLSIETVEKVEVVVEEIAARHPDVYASLTGIAKIGQDEMNSVGIYTQLLSLVAVILIYLLLAKSFAGRVMPLLALTPLLVGVLWALGALKIVFGSLNIMTAMMMLVLIGLGIDFSIHLVTRFREELAGGADLEGAVKVMLGGTGVGVITGATTTALAFFTLMVGDTRGVHEFGVAAGLGVILTLAAVFLMLPSLLVLRERRGARKASRGTAPLSGPASHGYRWIGSVAAAGYRRPGLFLAVAALIVAASSWAVQHTGFEYDFLELEAKGLRSVELQHEIPRRFGMSEHAAWLITDSIEESRELKERFRDLPDVGGVNAISDYLVTEKRLAEYAPKLLAFREGPLSREITAWRAGDGTVLAAEVDRLWDNLDLMSNLAFTAGLDRIVKVIDQVTGLDSETGGTDQSALLPVLSRQLEAGIDDLMAIPYAQVWAGRLKENLLRISNPAPIELDELPANIRRTFIPHTGDGYLLHIVPRGYHWEKTSMERFAAQAEAVDPAVISSEKLFLVMMEETLADGRKAAILALVVIALLLILHFRGPLGLLAMIPLIVGSFSMLGLMYVLGMKYNYINLIAVPIILGIGIDDGVHALHRYREETGEGIKRTAGSFRMVGKAILLTSITTMIGFGSVGFYEMRGMASFGHVLFMGVGMCFLATIFVLPAMLRIFHRNRSRSSKRGSTAAAALLALLFFALPARAQDLQISGYYEHTLSVDYTDKVGEKIIDASKLRLDFGSGSGSAISFKGNINFIIYHSDIHRDITPYLPESAAAQLSAEDIPAVYSLDRQRIYLDNAYLTWNRGTTRLRAGKQQLAWGPAYSFNPTDLFHRKNILDPTYEKEGVTALRFDYMWGLGGQLSLIAAPGEDLSDTGYALRLGTHVSSIGYDVAVTAHSVTDSTAFDASTYEPLRQQRNALGLEFSGSLFGLGVWLEGNYNEMKMEDNFSRVVLGLDYTLMNGLYIIGEALYNGRAEEKGPYPLHDWLANLAYGEPVVRWWFLAGASKDITDLTSGSLFVFGSPDGSMVLNPRLSASIAQNADLVVFGGFTFGEDEGAFPPGLFSLFARATVYF